MWKHEQVEKQCQQKQEMYVELISLFSKVLKNQCDSDDLDTLRNRINLISITGLIKYTNRVLGTLQGYICNSRPRRFGKSNKLLGVRHC